MGANPWLWLLPVDTQSMSGYEFDVGSATCSCHVLVVFFVFDCS
jgi:hypothetical protein